MFSLSIEQCKFRAYTYINVETHVSIGITRCTQICAKLIYPKKEKNTSTWINQPAGKRSKRERENNKSHSLRKINLPLFALAVLCAGARAV